MSLRLGTFTVKEKLNAIGLMGFGCYRIPGGFIVADLQDDEDGFSVWAEDINDALDETLEAFAEPDNE